MADAESGIECPECGKLLENEHGLHVHQGSTHKTNREQLPCPTCGETFTGKLGVRNHHIQVHGESLVEEEVKDVECPFCGDEFASMGGMRSHRAQVHNDSALEGVCEICGDDFHGEDADQKYCSKECMGIANCGENHPLWGGGKVILSCELCGDEFEKDPHEEKTSRFCSHECYWQWLEESGVHKGANNPVWCGGGRYYYGKNWSEKRQQALERDSYQCQGCGISQEEWVAERGYDLSVHHLKPFREFEDPKEANSLDNLVTMCKNCHKKWERIPLRPDQREI